MRGSASRGLARTNERVLTSRLGDENTKHDDLGEKVDTVKMTVVDASVTFHADDDGVVMSLTLHQNGDHPARRLTEEPWAPSTEDLGAYTGRYFSEELETFYDLVVEDDKLVLKHRRFDDITLRPGKEHEFAGGCPVAAAVFSTDDAGRITALEVSNGRTRGVRFVRVE